MGKRSSKFRHEFCRPVYLGDDLQDTTGRTIHDDDAYLTLPVLSLPGVVLIPGQTVPLHLFEPSVVAMVRHVLETDRTFGLLTARFPYTEPIDSAIGTTAEILAVKDDDDDRSGISVVSVKAIGRQRFLVKESRRQTDGIMLAKVLILPERILPDVLEGAIAPSLRRVTMGSKAKLKRISAYSTSWPPWVYQQYDEDYLMQKLRNELISWNEGLDLHSMPRKATEFSFWLASNLPLDDGHKMQLLSLDSAAQRLRCELSLMQRCTALCCKNCALRVAEKSDVFCMAEEGPMGAYVNPGGHVHETLTLYKASGLTLIGRPSTENSWFPGYAWTILECRNCTQHMGWKFTAVKRKLKPEKFWGLCRSSLLPGIQKDEEDEEWRPQM